MLFPAIIIAFLPGLLHLRQADGEDPIAACTVYCFGDSLTYSDHFVHELRTLLGPDSTVVNQGSVGDTTVMMLERFSDNVLESPPDFVVIWGGGQDIRLNVSPTTTRSNLQYMYTEAHNAGIKVVAMAMSPWKGGELWTRPKQVQTVSLHDWISNTAINVDCVVDSYKLLGGTDDPEALAPIYDTGDHIHFNHTAGVVIAQAIYNAIIPIIAQPSNLAPPDGARDWSLTPILQSSPFLHPHADDTHEASRWQITTISGNYSNPVLDRTDSTNLVELALSSGLLNGYTTYFWHVSYLDDQGLWSRWSVETSFTTMDRPPNRPVNTSPLDKATAVGLAPTLECSRFSDPDSGDTHAASRWQVRTDGGSYNSPVYDDVTDAPYLTSVGVPSGKLTNSTTYWWRVRHQDSHAAWSEWSTETSFITAVPPRDTTPPAAVANLAATAATANSVTLAWTPPGDDGTTGTASTYDIRYSTAYITDANWESASQCSGEPAPKAAGSPETFTVTGLSPDTTYYFAMKTADEVPNWSALSNVATEKTETTDTLPPTVTTSAATSIGPSSAMLNGNLISLGTVSSVTVSFIWGTVSGALNFETSPTDVMGSTGTFHFDLGSLSPSTTYYYKAKAVGNGTAYGAENNLTTTTTPPAVTTNDATSIATTSATLNGDLTSMGTATSVNVSFRCGTTSGGPYSLIAELGKDSAGTFSVVMDGLAPGCIYYYRVSADGDGDPVYGVEKSFTTGRSPEVEALDPDSGNRKQDLTATITGANLDGATTVTFGSGITVEGFSVNSGTEITAEITIDAHAAKGGRDVSVTTGWGTGTKTGGFNVAGGGGGVCSGGGSVTPGMPSEMTTTFAALGLMFGVGYLLVRRGARNRVRA